MKCTDCNGSGQYLGAGFGPIEVCRRCNGTKVDPDIHQAEANRRGISRAEAKADNFGRNAGVSRERFAQLTGVLPAGQYTATVTKVEQQVSHRTDVPFLAISYRLDNGQDVKQFLSLGPAAMWRVKETLNGLGMSPNIVESTREVRDMMLGKACTLELRPRGVGDAKYTQVVRVVPQAVVRGQHVHSLVELALWADDRKDVSSYRVSYEPAPKVTVIMARNSVADLDALRGELEGIVPRTMQVVVIPRGPRRR